MKDEFGQGCKGVLYSQYFRNKAIVLCKAAIEYFQYLFAPWNYSHTKPAKHRQSPLQYMYATGPRRRYFTRSLRSTGLSLRLSWPAMAGPYRQTLQKNLTST